MKKKILCSAIFLIVSSMLGGCFDQGNNHTTNIKVTKESKSGTVANEIRLSEEQIMANQLRFKNMIDKSHHISYGNSGDTIIVFFDPQCTHCHKLFETMQGEEFKSQHVIWIPVAFLNEKSFGQAAAILSSADPSKTLKQHESIYSKNHSGIEPLAKIDDQTKKKIEDNNQIFESTQFSGVPIMIKVNKSKQLEAMPGGVPIEYIRDFLTK